MICCDFDYCRSIYFVCFVVLIINILNFSAINDSSVGGNKCNRYNCQKPVDRRLIFVKFCRLKRNSTGIINKIVFDNLFQNKTLSC